VIRERPRSGLVIVLAGNPGLHSQVLASSLDYRNEPFSSLLKKGDRHLAIALVSADFRLPPEPVPVFQQAVRLEDLGGSRFQPPSRQVPKQKASTLALVQVAAAIRIDLRRLKTTATITVGLLVGDRPEIFHSRIPRVVQGASTCLNGGIVASR
jgi:hypothetical protein